MSRQPKAAAISDINTVALVTLDYQVPLSTVTSPNLVITNLSATIVSVSIYINDTFGDFLLVTRTLPAKTGISWRVAEIADQKLNTDYTIKVQTNIATPINYFLSVSEISDN